MKKILFIGSPMFCLVAAQHLSQKNEIHLIELHAEIGMPTSQPGFIHDFDLLADYLTKDQLLFLKPYDNQPGWGLRSEWVTKHLAMNAANKGVHIHTRTRIISIENQNGQYLVNYLGAGPQANNHLLVDIIVDGSPYVPSAPGGLQHTLPEHLNFKYPELGVTTNWFGGTALTTDCQEVPEQAWTFDRAEGLSEVWFEGKSNWTPKHGWIEYIESLLPFTASQRTIDAQITEGKRLSGAIL
jgi:hypothetical protein